MSEKVIFNTLIFTVLFIVGVWVWVEKGSFPFLYSSFALIMFLIKKK